MRGSWLALSVTFVCFSMQAADTTEIEILEVKGAKMRTSIERLPASASVITNAEIERARINHITDIESYVPNLKFGQYGEVGARFISIRGIGSNPLNENRVAVYVDDVPFRTINDHLLVDVSQIEVLRGPQGTLYGSNTEGGVIVVNSASTEGPLSFKSKISSELYDQGNRTHYLFGGSGTLSNDWSGRIVVSGEKGDTYTQNIDPSASDKGEFDDQSLMATLNYFPTEKLKIGLQFMGEFSRADGIYEQTYIPINADLYNQAASQFNLQLLAFTGVAVANTNVISDRYQYHMDDSRYFDENERVSTLRVSYDFDAMRLLSVTSYREHEAKGMGAQFDMSSLPYNNTGGSDKREEWYQELRLESDFDDDFVWVAGVSLFDSDRSFAVVDKDIIGGASQVNHHSPLFEDNRDMSVFANSRISLTDKLGLTAGLRWERSNKQSIKHQASAFYLFGAEAYQLPAVNDQLDFSQFLPKLALDYQFSNFTSGYLTAAKGWQAGGINDDVFAVQEHQQRFQYYDAETLWNYEAGLRGHGLNRAVTWSAAVFLSQAKNWQEMNFVVSESGQAISTAFVANAKDLRSVGAEAELSWRVSDDLTLSATVGYTDSEYRSFDLVDTQDYSGNQTIMMPEHSAAIIAEYDFTDKWYGVFEARHFGEMQLNLANSVQQGAYQVVDLQVGWRGEQFSFALFTDNLFDEYYFAGQAHSGFLPDFADYAPPGSPRRIGIEIGYEF